MDLNDFFSEIKRILGFEPRVVNADAELRELQRKTIKAKQREYERQRRIEQEKRAKEVAEQEEADRVLKKEKERVKACAVCGKNLLGLDQFKCHECNDYYCYEHRLHAAGHQSETPEELPLVDFGYCKNCKKKINNVLDSTYCIKCGLHLCYDCSLDGNHKCKPRPTYVPRLHPFKKLDPNFSPKEIEAMRKARKELLKIVDSRMEISGIITYEGKLKYLKTGNPESVNPEIPTGLNIKGIMFHIHPNEAYEPSAPDRKYAAYMLSQGCELRFIVVTQLGFASYGPNPGSVLFYGWSEI
jgi:predicted nucleic acid binding AN1-type Zn finger protein